MKTVRQIRAMQTPALKGALTKFGNIAEPTDDQRTEADRVTKELARRAAVDAAEKAKRWVMPVAQADGTMAEQTFRSKRSAHLFRNAQVRAGTPVDAFGEARNLDAPVETPVTPPVSLEKAPVEATAN